MADEASSRPVRRAALRFAARLAAKGLDRLEDVLLGPPAEDGGRTERTERTDRTDRLGVEGFGRTSVAEGPGPAQPGFTAGVPFTTTDSTGARESALMKAEDGGMIPGSRGSLPGDPVGDPEAIYWDPFALVEQLGYKEKPTAITYGTLQAMVWQLPILRAVIKTRVDQVASFCQPQMPPHEPGFRVRMREAVRTPQRFELKEMQRLEDWLMTTGVVRKDRRERHGMEHLIRQVVNDSLTYDQVNLEIVPDRRGRPCQWYAVDPATIRFVDSAKLAPEHDMDAPYCVQIYDNVVIGEFSRRQMAFGIRNPRTDIRSHGYGTCLHPGTSIKTTEGLRRVRELACGDGRFSVEINGRSIPARAYATGAKPLWRLSLDDGRVLHCSPDHRLQTCSASTGRFEWRRLEELKPGDVVASDVTPLREGVSLGRWRYTPEASARSAPWQIDHAGADLWEVLGWMVGDGNFRVCAEGDTKDRQYGRCVTLFYFGPGEDIICERHRAILRKYGLPDAYYPAETGYEVRFNHEGFGRWLEDQAGSAPMNLGGSRVPQAALGLPWDERCAFLRGLFSADGSVSSKGENVVLGCTDAGLLADVQRLLWSLGIRSRIWTGTVHKDVGREEKGCADGGLYVYDKDPFFAEVGYLQESKRPIFDDSAADAVPGAWQGTRADVVCSAFAARYALALIESRTSRDPDFRRLSGLVQDPPRWGVTRRWLRDRLEGVSASDLDWHHARVESVIDIGEEIEMYDVEVFDDVHAFVAEGLIVHNSESEMMVSAITYLLWGFQYNAKYFSQGSIPKGVLNIKGPIPERQLRAFRRQWYQMVSGVESQFRTPIVNAEELEWLALDKSNRDMEFSLWLDFLIKIVCAIFAMDPIEVNFKYGGTGQKSMFEAANKVKIVESKAKGLQPLLKFLARIFNENVLWPNTADFAVEFTGLSPMTAKELADLETQKVRTYMMIDEIRAMHDLPPIPDGLGQFINDPNWMEGRREFLLMQQEAQQRGAAQQGGAAQPAPPAPPERVQEQSSKAHGRGSSLTPETSVWEIDL